MSAANDYRYDRNEGPRDRSLRVGDKEREAVGEILRRRHLEGRLDTDELQDRLERCLAAKTYAELDRLIADFPSEESTRRRQPGLRPQRWSRPLPVALLPLVAIAAIAAAGHVAWLVFPLVCFFVIRRVAWRGSAARVHCSSGPRRTTRGRSAPGTFL